MNHVLICERVLEPQTWKNYECSDVRDFILGYFPQWPETAKVYHRIVAECADVTPFDEPSVDRLGRLEGQFYVVVYPELPVWVIIVIAIVVAAVAVGLAFLLRPSFSPNIKNHQQTSPNNSLSARQNSERVGERVPDIYGEIQSIPDLLAVPYIIFVNSAEVEVAYMAVGRGDYQIEQQGSHYRVYDDTTPIDEIAGATIEIYAPNKSPNSGDAPQLRIGTAINRPVTTVKRFTAVNGQTLLAPNASNVTGNNDIRFVYPDTIQTDNPNEDLTKRFAAADSLLVVGNAVDSGGQPTVSMNGTYVVLSVTGNQIVLSNPAAVNANWNALNAFTGHASTYGSPALSTSGPRWIGPYIVNVNDVEELWCNFVAKNGLYKDDGKNQYAISVDILVGIQAIDNTGATIGSERFYSVTVVGESTVRNQRGITLEAILPLAGPCQVRAQRTTTTDTTFQGTVVDEVQWRDLYSSSPIIQTHFGDITTIQSATYATEGALSVKDRKLNLIVTRKIKVLNGDGTLTAGIAATKDAGSILCALTLDPNIGNRTVAELDTVNIAQTITAINAYFGTSLATQFCYTFDDAKVSFEESVADIANSIFCTPYRRGNIIKLFFEKLTNNSVAIFNHRNKLPKSEVRTVTFGPVSEYDGVELDFVNPTDPTYQNIDTRETLYFPPDQSARNARKVKTIGIHNIVQATLLGWRLYNKIRFQNTAVQFTATQEAALRILNERILVADNTRPDTQDGEVIAVDSLLLTLSQPFKYDPLRTYTIFLNLWDDSVQSLAIAPGPAANQVILGSAPALAMIVDAANYARTTYVIVSDLPTRSSAFLLAEKTPKDGMTYEIKAINYDDRYYSHDNDFVDGILADTVITPANAGGYAAGGAYPGPSGTQPVGGQPDPTGDSTGGYNGTQSSDGTYKFNSL